MPRRNDPGGSSKRSPPPLLAELARQRLARRELATWQAIDHEGLRREGFEAIGGPGGFILLPLLDYDPPRDGQSADNQEPSGAPEPTS